MDAQLEATYEGPEAVQRRQLSVTMAGALFLAQFGQQLIQMRQIAATHPDTGAGALAAAMQLWEWTLNHLLEAEDPGGRKLYRDQRQGVTFPMADALCWLLAARLQILDVIELEQQGGLNPALADGLPGTVQFMTDLCHVQSARAAGEVGRICAELVHGYRQPTFGLEPAGAGRGAGHADEPGIEAGPGSAHGAADPAGTQADSAQPVPSVTSLDGFARLRGRLDSCLTGARLAKDRAAAAVAQVMIPEALDYPL
jgi:hypothetical protein